MNENELLRVRGPAKIKVGRGSLYALGRELKEGEELTVTKSKVVCVKAITSCELKALIGGGGGLEEAKGGEESVDEWSSKLPEALQAELPLKVLVLGATDTGKSTATTFLVNMAISRGLKVAVIDSDVGQNDIAPPSTIGLAFAKGYISSLRELKAEKVHFIGSITPSGYECEIVHGLRELMGHALNSGADAVIINTDGWIRGSYALKFKLNMLKATLPDAIVGLQRGGELESLLKGLEAYGWRVIRLRTPPAAPKRDHRERRELRSLSYNKYFANSKRVLLNLLKVPILNSPLFKGVPISPQDLKTLLGEGIEVCHCERVGDEGYLIVDGEAEILRLSGVKKVLGVSEVIVHKRGQERGLIVGLLGEGLEPLGLGVIEEIDYGRKLVKIITPVEGHIKGLLLGRVKVIMREEGGGFKVVEDFQR